MCICWRLTGTLDLADLVECDKADVCVREGLWQHKRRVSDGHHMNKYSSTPMVVLWQGSGHQQSGKWESVERHVE